MIKNRWYPPHIVSDSVGLGCGLTLCISNISSQVMLLCLVQGPSFENHCPVSLRLNPLCTLFSFPGSLESLTAGEAEAGGQTFEPSQEGTWESQCPVPGWGAGCCFLQQHLLPI